MSTLNRYLPFSAVVGMDDVKRALACAVINDDLRGVLIKGPGGTAKTLLVRSFVNVLPGMDIVNVPQNVTEEQLFGGMDVEYAITHGKAVMKEGLLKRADDNILYLDNINLFDDRILNSIMDCVESGTVRIEREGISSEYECKTTVIATMDPAERMLSDHLSDRFDICVQTRSVRDETGMQMIIDRVLDFDSDPAGFAEQFAEQDRAVAESIDIARSRLGMMRVTRSDLEKVSKICMELDAVGYRGDISMARVAMTLAALGGDDGIRRRHIEDAAVMCLLHRRTSSGNTLPTGPGYMTDTNADDADITEQNPKKQHDPDMGRQAVGYSDSDTRGIGFGEPPGTSGMVDAVRDRLEDFDRIESIRLHEIAGSNRRRDVVTEKHSGRYRNSRIPEGRSLDPAFDATVKAAAPFQRIRGKKGLSITIEAQDIRDKIRVKRKSCSFLFAVDVSGSLVKNGRMQNVKDGVRAMFMEGYVQRDKIALMTFTYRSIVVSVPFTRSLEHIYDILDDTPAGGCTPLGEALLRIREYMINYTRRNSEEHCYVILITDGEANEPVLRNGDAQEELENIVLMMNIPNTEWVVIDSGLVSDKESDALRLAEMLGGRYIRLDDLGTI